MYAKTLYKTQYPDNIKAEISQYTNHALPHFFKYAKDKGDNQVEDVNDSLVNKLDKMIVNPKLYFKRLGLNKVRYRFMVNDSEIDFKYAFTSTGAIDKDNTEPLIVKYLELSKVHYMDVDSTLISNLRKDMLTKSQLKHQLLFGEVVKNAKKEMSQFGYTDEQIADILVKFLYYIKPSSHKGLLWCCYGDIIYKNLERNVNELECVDCGKEKGSHLLFTNCRCDDCNKKYLEYKKTTASVRNENKYDNDKELNMFKGLVGFADM